MLPHTSYKYKVKYIISMLVVLWISITASADHDANCQRSLGIIVSVTTYQVKGIISLLMLWIRSFISMMEMVSQRPDPSFTSI